MRMKLFNKRVLSFGLAVLILCSNNPLYTISVNATTPPLLVEVSGVNKTPNKEWSNQEVEIKGQVINGTAGSNEYSIRYSTDVEAFEKDSVADSEAIMTANNITKLNLDSTKNFSFDTTQGTSEKTYYIWAYDGEETKSKVITITCKIDKQSPTVNSIVSSANELRTNKAITISGTVLDEGGSGVAKVRYSYKLIDFEQDTFASIDKKEASLQEEKYSFVVDTEEGDVSLKETCYVWTYDVAGNKSTDVKEIKVDIDKTAPVINSVSKTPYDEWTNQPVTIKVDALQNNPKEVKHQVIGIRHSFNNDYNSATTLTEGANGVYTFTIPAKDFKGDYYIWAVNGQDNETRTSIPIKIDATTPTITNYEFRTINDGKISKAINFFSRGLFCNKAIEVTVTGADEGASSGLKEISLYGNGELVETKSVNSNKQAKFILAEPFDKEISATINDVVGNQSAQIKPSDVNGELKDKGNRVHIESNVPTIEIIPSTESYTDNNKNKWYNQDATFQINAEDTDSGLKSVEISLNETVLSKDATEKMIQSNYGNTDIKLDSYFISTTQGSISPENTYTLKVKVVDKSNNEIEKTITIHKDIEKPSVVKAEFSPLGNHESKGQIVQTAKYGYFFKDNTQITLTAEDNTNGSQVKSITYYTVDYSENKSGIQSETKTTTVDENNQISFLLRADFKGKIYAKATDQVALTGDFVTPDASVVESVAKHEKTSSITMNKPDTSKKDNSGLELYSQEVPVEFTIGDYYSGLAKVEWSVVSPYDTANNQSGIMTVENDKTLNGNTDGIEITQNDENLVTEVKKTIQVTNNSNNIKIKAKLTDRVGHTTEKEINFSIDKTVPTISLSYDNNHQDFVKGKKYYKENRTATIVVTERNFKKENAIISIKNRDGEAPTLSNWVENKNPDNEDKTTYTATATFIDDGDYSVDMSFEDLAGNKAQTIEQQKFIIDKTVPIIGIKVSDAYYTTDEKKQWHKENTKFTIDTIDKGSGLQSVEVSINGEPLLKDNTGKEIKTNYQDTQTKSETFIVNTSQVTQAKDDIYNLQVTVIDQAGNKKTTTKTVQQDTQKPSITKIKFSPVDAGDVKAQIVKTNNYGYFFKDNTVVTLTAQDNEGGSGVDTITYYLVDFSNSKTGIKSQVITKKVKNNQYSFVIPADFKGKIYAKATDHVERTSDFVSPGACIIESAKTHRETASITMVKPNTSAKDNKGLDLYTKDVSIEFTLSDDYSGLAKVEWSAESSNDTQSNQSGQVNINSDGLIEEPQEGVTVTKRDKNLATQVTKTLRVTNNSNNIKVKVKLTDKVGHTSEEELNFSIDKTAPTVSVSYDNNDYDSDFARETQYYKQERNATVTITERNFQKEDAKITITNSDGTAPTISNWVENKNSENEDKTTYTAMVSYIQDGDYSFGMSFEDLGGNQAGTIESQKFTIDKTVPTIQISYNNNQVETSNYYKEARTATITINEHNFETSRIKAALSAKEGTSAPSIGSWSSNADTHTATVTFQEDSLYTFNMEYTDKAGNPAQKLPDETFYVDKTVPTLTVTGIKNNSANSGKDANKNEEKVGFVIESTDENFANATPHLSLVTLEGTKNCDHLLGNPQNIQSGQRYMVENLKSDGIYILSATAVDKAGNETKAARVTSADGSITETEQISFSINRNGSVYTLDAKTQKINGSYSKEETDIIIQETNVNGLNTMKLTLFNDTTTRVLEEGKDFKLDTTAGNGQWNQYTYTVFKENFKEDGFYSLAIYSVDEATNESENTLDTKNVEVRFAIDKTAPNLILTDLEDKKAYAAGSKQVTMVINDNIKLEEVSVYHTTYQGSQTNTDYGKPSATWTTEEIQQMQKENVDFTYNIDGVTTEKHKVKIVARDAAGSESVVEVADFYVTKNMWVNFKTDSVKVFGSIGGVAILVVGFMGVMILSKRKKNLA